MGNLKSDMAQRSAGSAVDTFGTCKVDKPFVVVLGKVTGPFREYFLPVQD